MLERTPSGLYIPSRRYPRFRDLVEGRGDLLGIVPTLQPVVIVDDVSADPKAIKAADGIVAPIASPTYNYQTQYNFTSLNFGVSGAPCLGTQQVDLVLGDGITVTQSKIITVPEGYCFVIEEVIMTWQAYSGSIAATAAVAHFSVSSVPASPSGGVSVSTWMAMVAEAATTASGYHYIHLCRGKDGEALEAELKCWIGNQTWVQLGPKSIPTIVIPPKGAMRFYWLADTGGTKTINAVQGHAVYSVYRY